MDKSGLEIDNFCKIYGERIRFVRFAQSYLHNETEAEDVVADVFSKVWETRDNLRDSYSEVKAYIYTLLRNRCVDIIRRNAKKNDIHTHLYRNISDEELNVLENVDVIHKVFASEVQAILRGATDKLDERSMSIFTDNRVNGMTYKEIADKYGMTFDQVAKNISKTLAVLSRELKDYLPLLLLLFLSHSK